MQRLRWILRLGRNNVFPYGFFFSDCSNKRPLWIISVIKKSKNLIHFFNLKTFFWASPRHEGIPILRGYCITQSQGRIWIFLIWLRFYWGYQVLKNFWWLQRVNHQNYFLKNHFFSQFEQVPVLPVPFFCYCTIGISGIGGPKDRL